jgi:hypothetical protein
MLSSTKAKIDWTVRPPQAWKPPYPVYLYIGTDKNAVSQHGTLTGGCPGPGCLLKMTFDSTATTYTTGDILAPGTVYYFYVVTSEKLKCVGLGAARLSSCDLRPAVLNLKAEQSWLVEADVNSNEVIKQVDFTAGSTDILVNPATDWTYLYQTNVTAVNPTDNASLTANVVLNEIEYGQAEGCDIDYHLLGVDCSGSTSVYIVPAISEAWWQVKDSDVLTGGNLRSVIPGGDYFGLKGPGGYPGVAIYIDTNLVKENVSETGWLVSSPSLSLSQKVYNYSYFAKLIPETLTPALVEPSSVEGSYFETGGTEDADGYSWYKFDGTTGATKGQDLTISSDLNLVGERKVILLVDTADLNLNGKINLEKGKGFFLAIVGNAGLSGKGNIVVDPAVGGSADGVPELEGLFLADGVFKTGAGASQLHVRGSVVGYGGVSLDRDTGTTSPSELFEFAPDLVFNFPPALSTRRMRWKEVAP